MTAMTAHSPTEADREPSRLAAGGPSECFGNSVAVAFAKALRAGTARGPSQVANRAPKLHLRWWLPAILLFAMTACATRPKIDWNARIGTYTLDQAVLELGPADKQAELEDGRVVAEWLTQHSYVSSYPTMGYPWYYSQFYPPYYYPQSYHTSPNYYLNLVFGPDGRLQSWKKFTK